MDVRPIKNIIVLCDGTWNGASVGTRTNIMRLSELIQSINPHPNITNVLPPGGSFQGVGIGGGVLEFFSNGFFAQDLDNKIKQAYKFIVTNYESRCNNRVWLFGFSRGAYTVRSVAGMINNCGIIDKDKCNGNIDDTISIILNMLRRRRPRKDDALYVDDAVNLAYDIYRDRSDEYSPRGDLAKKFRERLSHHCSDSSIVFMGLWDTVGAHGLPSYGYNGFEYFEFYDKLVSSNIDYVYQAVATHENIALFEHCPILQRSGASNTVEEKWFPGIHLDIGGFIGASIMPTYPLGYILDRTFGNPISDATLNWMIENINTANVQQMPSPGLGGTIHAQAGRKYFRLIVQTFRRSIRFASSLGTLKLIIADRNITYSLGNPTSILYNGGKNWRDIANPADYGSRAYIVFSAKCLALEGIVIPQFAP